MIQVPIILNKLTEISNNFGTSRPYICGGIPRDKLLGRLNKIEDIDISTGDESVHTLADKLAESFRAKIATAKDGHKTVIIENLKIDFSSNYVVPNLKEALVKFGVKNPKPIQLEMYSRDYTINSLIMSLDLKKIIDPIGLGFEDLQNKILRTCLPPAITIGNDPKRIVRAIYLAAKLDLTIEDRVVEYISSNTNLLSRVSNSYIAIKLIAAFKHNPTITKKYINELNLKDVIPKTLKLNKFLT